MGTPLWGALLLVVTPTARAARTRAARARGAARRAARSSSSRAPPDDPFGPWAIGGDRRRRSRSRALAPARRAGASRSRTSSRRRRASTRCSTSACCCGRRRSSTASSPACPTRTTWRSRRSARPTTWAVWTWAGDLARVVARACSTSRCGSVDRGRRRAQRGPLAPTASPRDESDRDARRRSPATAPGETAPSEPADTAGP